MYPFTMPDWQHDVQNANRPAMFGTSRVTPTALVAKQACENRLIALRPARVGHSALDAMSNHPPSNVILAVNPYEAHPSLTPLEAAALWEYAKLAYNVRMVRNQ